MNDREKLIEIINNFFGCDASYFGVHPYDLATHLLENGVALSPKCEDCVFTIIKAAKAEAIKEFWKRLKLEREPITRVVFVEKGDVICKEMTEQ
jgi:hypothetical protein